MVSVQLCLCIQPVCNGVTRCLQLYSVSMFNTEQNATHMICYNLWLSHKLIIWLQLYNTLEFNTGVAVSCGHKLFFNDFGCCWLFSCRQLDNKETYLANVSTRCSSPPRGAMTTEEAENSSGGLWLHLPFSWVIDIQWTGSIPISDIHVYQHCGWHSHILELLLVLTVHVK